MEEDRRDVVILLHGVGARPAMLWPVARALARAGYRTVSLGYPSRTRPLTQIVDLLAARIASEAPGKRIHFVGHSMGSLVIQAIIARHRPPVLGRVVMLAPPLGGSEWVSLLRGARLDRLALRHAADLLAPQRPEALTAMLGTIDYPLGIIAGNRSLGPLLPRIVMPRPNDGKVTVAATRVAGAAGHIVLPVSHTLMLLSRDVHRQILAFLREGRFTVLAV